MPKAPAKRVVRCFYEALFHDLPAAEACLSPDYVDHNNPGAGRGPAMLRAHVAGLRRTFPDFSLRIEDMIAEGDTVVTRVSGRGTHAGAWMGIAPTGALVTVKGINIDRVIDGRIAEHWGEADTLRMLAQMGVDPLAPGARRSPSGRPPESSPPPGRGPRSRGSSTDRRED